MAAEETSTEKRTLMVKRGKAHEIHRIDIHLPKSIQPDTNDTHNRPPEAGIDEFHLLNPVNPVSVQYIACTQSITENGKEKRRRAVLKRLKLENLGFFGTDITKFKEELLRTRFLKNSPHIVQEFGSFHETKDGKPIVFYSIMERMDHPLSVYFDFLKKTDGTPREKKRDHRHMSAFLTQALRALEFLHSQGIVHGNICPEKIGMNKQNFQIKLLDFGKKRRANLDEEVQSIGLPLYEPPEVIFNGVYSMKMDIWALAVCAVEFLGFSLFNPNHGDERDTQTHIRRFGTRHAVLRRQMEVLAGLEVTDSFPRLDLDAFQKSEINTEKLHSEIPYSRLDIKRDPLNVYNLQQLFEKMFDINSNRRPTAGECLKMTYLELMNRKYETLTDRFISIEEGQRIHEKEKSELNNLIQVLSSEIVSTSSLKRESSNERFVDPDSAENLGFEVINGG